MEEIQDTSGFYRNDQGFLSYGKNYVMSGYYNLLREQKDEYTYPVNGWYWFDSEDQAREYFNLPKPIMPESRPFGANF